MRNTIEKPAIVIATNYEALFAYMLIPYGDPALVKRIEFACDGQTSCPLLRWEDKKLCYKELAGMIHGILERYQCEEWALACRSEQEASIRNELGGHYRESLSAVIETDIEPINLCNVEDRFIEEASGIPTPLAALWA